MQLREIVEAVEDMHLGDDFGGLEEGRTLGEEEEEEHMMRPRLSVMEKGHSSSELVVY
jgi:hypothetical protein